MLIITFYTFEKVLYNTSRCGQRHLLKLQLVIRPKQKDYYDIIASFQFLSPFGLKSLHPILYAYNNNGHGNNNLFVKKCGSGYLAKYHVILFKGCCMLEILSQEFCRPALTFMDSEYNTRREPCQTPCGDFGMALRLLSCLSMS